MGEQPEPWKCELRVVVTGGFLKKPWPVEVQLIDTEAYMSLQTTHNRDLARALGLDSSLRSPFSNVTVFDYIKSLRDSKIDDLITEHMKKNDPMAEDTPSARRLDSQGRVQKFEDAGVPATVEIDLPSFVDGDLEIPAYTMTVASTPKRLGAPRVQVRPEVFDWLLKAIKHDWSSQVANHGDDPTPTKRQRDVDVPELPELAKPLKYRFTGKLAIYFNYRGISGTWNRKTTQIDNMMGSDPVANRNLIENLSVRMLELYNNYHHPNEHEEPAEPAENHEGDV